MILIWLVLRVLLVTVTINYIAILWLALSSEKIISQRLVKIDLSGLNLTFILHCGYFGRYLFDYHKDAEYEVI